jgi:(p)ppGpp synthase/HD superfamily hydrolase
MTLQLEHPLISKCLDIAIKAHSGQYRRDGRTHYMDHVYEVTKRVKKFDDDHICVALLHDVIEGSDITADDLLKEGVPENIVEAVSLLTKYVGITYKKYLVEIKGNELARRVKIADMLSNLADDPTDNQIKKYAKGLDFLVDYPI